MKMFFKNAIKINWTNLQLIVNLSAAKENVVKHFLINVQ